jgi:O-antigen/teichoic acid export membrane protein
MKDTTSLGIGREALSSFISNVVMGAVGFGGTILFARFLGASGLGVYQTAVAAALVFAKVSDGVAGAIQKRVSEVDVIPGSFLGAGLIIHTVLSVIISLGVLLLHNPIKTYLSSTAVSLAVVAVVVSLGLFNITNNTLSGIGYPARSSWMDTVRSMLTIACQVTLLWFGLGTFGLVAGLAIASAATAVFSAQIAGVRPTLPTRSIMRSISEYARWSVPNGLLNKLYSSLDILVITAAAGSSAAGLYAVARQLTQPATFLSSSISGALSVKTSGRHSAGQEIVQDLLNSVSYSGLIAIPLFFGALAMPRAIPQTVFGGEFAAAGGAVVGMAIFQVWNVYASQFESVFTGIDRPGIVFRINAGITTVHLPLAVGLGYLYGLLGVVTATVVAETLRFVVYQYLIYAKFNRIALSRPIAEQVLSGFVMFVGLEAVLSYAEVTGWLVLLLLVGGGAVGYFLMLIAVSSHFRFALRHAVPVEYGPLKTP